MKLIKLKVTKFKSINDSNEFSLKDVTCLVGKNESGKTSLLSALYKLNPVEETEKEFDVLKEYPRSELTDYEDAIKSKAKTHDTVIISEWELKDIEYRTIEALYCPKCLISNKVKILKGYYNYNYAYDDCLNQELIINSFLKKSGLDKRIHKKIYEIKTFTAFKKYLDDNKEDAGIIAFQAELNKRFTDNYFSAKFRNFVHSKIPKFLYFSDYYRMSGEVAINDIKNKISNNTLKDSDKVFLSLLEMAGTSIEEIDSIDKYDRLKAKLEGVSVKISREIFNFWTQNKNLKVQFDYSMSRPADPAPLNTGYIFRTNIYNTTHEVSLNFNDRSSGFVWFFSFLVWFSQIKQKFGDNLIILLDEPGLNLHAKAQGDLLKYINEKLKPQFQVIYTTHSPFMVDPENLNNVKIVEDVITTEGDILGTKVREDILAVDKETLFPLQAALGYDITQSLFIGKNALLVEGPSDLLYIKWISSVLKEKKREFLSEKWTVTPVGGIDKIGSFIALFGGNKLNISVLTDYHKGDKNKIKGLRESQILEQGRLFTCESFLQSRDEADIEDLLGREFYIDLVSNCYQLKSGNKLPKDKPQDAPELIVKEVENHFATLPPDVPEFDHFAPSLFLLENSKTLKDKITGLDNALNIFEEVFKRLNSLL